MVVSILINLNELSLMKLAARWGLVSAVGILMFSYSSYALSRFKITRE